MRQRPCPEIKARGSRGGTTLDDVTISHPLFARGIASPPRGAKPSFRCQSGMGIEGITFSITYAASATTLQSAVTSPHFYARGWHPEAHAILSFASGIASRAMAERSGPAAFFSSAMQPCLSQAVEHVFFLEL